MEHPVEVDEALEHALEVEAVENAPSGIGIFDLAGQSIRMRYLNDGFYRMIGASREERTRFFDTGTIESVHPDDRAGLLAEAQAALEEGRPFEYRFRNLDGNGAYIWIGITASHRPAANGVERFYASYYSVERFVVAQEEEKRRYEKSLQDAMSAVPLAVASAHVDLTENRFEWARTLTPNMQQATHAKTWDGLTEHVAGQAAHEQDRIAIEVFHSDRLLAAFERGEASVSFTYRRYDERGKVHWIDANIRMFRNPENGHVEGIAYALDATNEKRREEIFQIMTSRGFDLVALIHLESRTFEAIHIGETLPAAYHRLLPEDGAICNFDEFCAESSKHMEGETRQAYESQLSSGYIRGEIERNGGSYEFTLEEHFDSAGAVPVYRRYLHYGLADDPDSVLVIESDVTKEVTRQKELLVQAKREAERDRAIMESITCGIAELRLSDNGVLTVDSFNQQMFRMLGYDPSGLPQRAEEAKGTPLESAFADALTFVHPDDRDAVKKSFTSFSGETEFSVKPYRMQKSDGSYSWIAEDVRVHERTAGYCTYYATYRDVTWEIEAREELKMRLEEERVLRAKADAANEAKSDFLSRMSHDIRTPLNGVIGMSYLAREQDNPPRTMECLDKIDTSAKFLLGLINDVLDMSKVESGEIELRPEPYPVEEFNSYLDAVIKPLCEAKGQAFDVIEESEGDACPLVDKQCINKVLFNLLSNAIKFTPEGGAITYHINTKRISEDRVAIEHCIEDTGTGISDQFRSRLFDPFSQEGRDDSSETRGSGLGLAIVKRLVDLMGGTIDIESELGRGTTVKLYFEFDAAPEAAKPQASELQDAQLGSGIEGMRLLLCEDHPLNQEIAKALLEGKGAVVDVAADGQEGVAMFERSTPGSYDAVLMDIRMPVMDGYRATHAIRALGRTDAQAVPIIAMTADAFEDDVRKCIDAGMNAHIAKPIDPQHLYAVILECVEERKDC